MSYKPIEYFVTANSSDGFVNLLASNISDIKYCYVLTGKIMIYKQKIISDLIDFLTSREETLELIRSSYTPEAYDGFILRDKSMAVISNSIYEKAPEKEDCHSDNHALSVTNSGNIVCIIDTDKIASQLSNPYHFMIDEAQRKSNTLYHSAYQLFSQGIAIHDKWEAIYISNMDFSRAEHYTDEVINKIFSEGKTGTGAQTRHRFFGCATWKGSFDLVPEIIAPLKNRYFIKGRPGSGKSTMMKKIMTYSTEHGFETHVYHCGFDPKSLDMILIPALSTCIFDSTAPHEYFPENMKNNISHDEVLDMYQELIQENTDERYQDELEEIKTKYSSIIQQGTRLLKLAHSYDESVNQFYLEHMNTNRYCHILLNLIDKLV